MKLDKTAIKPYGDSLNDGKVQMSFTLPLEASPEAREAARIMANKMGLDEVNVVEMQDLGEGFSFFVLYGKAEATVDATKIKVAKVETEAMDYYEINDYIEENIGRKLTVVGACTGSDAHTVGLDAIMNMKGYAGEYGLERYPQFNAHNMGSQVPNEELIKKAVETEADAILVSQVVTQREIHVKNLTELVELLEAEGLREKFVLIVGGPRITHELALELGFDAGFGKDTLPPDVATYIAKKVAGEI
ncbi:OAM dimerization domain-containing protein [Natranaerobius thermophilus]|uniref:Beta-lysine 5,6-aminomutase beta subunit, D-lysine 5,6-aminomutase beta subunit n=1 Tax=Natranaerobius thermophilus (strain ATCC BAA-1301 / DSM 18059 / JW/NM-WN-LF) TaxID=457570 RepID=B2A659_NATTJ|nr:OAM dimerization domain-containing protein [Natranaerobius thermophilus]ACB85476.1 beta-lysine 5,6-aminomutase beta subunit, D-lysine 5,6-aminomutase beta subunit [Natranaerobius thermophilus JW/NM-WN-LF]